MGSKVKKNTEYLAQAQYEFIILHSKRRNTVTSLQGFHIFYDAPFLTTVWE